MSKLKHCVKCMFRGWFTCTFCCRQSLQKCTEDKIAQNLAVLLCFIDTNNNLDFLKTNLNATWQTDLWLGIFQCEKYVLDHVRDHENLTNFHVEPKGFNGQLYNPQFPFSWIVFQRVEELLKSGEDISDGNSLTIVQLIYKIRTFVTYLNWY